jgi:uncharacterized protein (TIGR03437 family)
MSPVFSSTASGIQAAPIDVTPPRQVYLILFGSGFDAATLSSTQVTIAQQRPALTFAGPQPTFPGLDQVNVPLPDSLVGTGKALVMLTVAGQLANTVYVNIQ